MRTKLICFTFLLFGFPFLANADFSDVLDTTRYAEDIRFIAKQGFIQGYGDGTFRPEQSITRAEFTKILLLSTFPLEKIADCTNISFPDAAPGEWYISYLCFAKQEGIVKGFLNGTFGPNEDIIYSAAAKIIVNTLLEKQEEQEGEDWWHPFSQSLSEKNAVPPTVKGGNHRVTRGEMAYMIAVLLREKEKIAEDEKIAEEEGASKEDESGAEEKVTPEDVETEGVPENTDTSHEEVPEKTYTSDHLGLSFSYFSEKEGKEVFVFEIGTKIILAVPNSQNDDDFAACVADGLCSERDGERFSHVDAFYVLTKSTQDEDFLDAILRKISELGKDPDDCNLQSPPYTVENWMATQLSVAHPKALDTNMGAAEKRNAEEQETIEKCSFYAGGYGRSFFLYNPNASYSYFLYLPSFGEQGRVVRYETLHFE